MRCIQTLHLDPLCKEMGFTRYEGGQWQVLITIEGCSKLFNAHGQFNGLAFSQSDSLIDAEPKRVEYAIYRRYRMLPITIREHLVEIYGDNSI